MVRVTLTIDLPEWWGADDAWADGGASAVEDLCKEDLSALVEDAVWKIELVN